MHKRKIIEKDIPTQKSNVTDSITTIVTFAEKNNKSQIKVGRKESLSKDRKRTITSNARGLTEKCDVPIMVIFRNKVELDRGNYEIFVSHPDFLECWKSPDYKMKESFITCVNKHVHHNVVLSKEKCSNYEENLKDFDVCDCISHSSEEFRYERGVDFQENESLRGKNFLDRRRSLINKANDLLKIYGIPTIMILRGLKGDIEVIANDMEDFRQLWDGKTIDFKNAFIHDYSKYCIENNKVMIRKRNIPATAAAAAVEEHTAILSPSKKKIVLIEDKKSRRLHDNTVSILKFKDKVIKEGKQEGEQPNNNNSNNNNKESDMSCSSSSDDDEHNVNLRKSSSVTITNQSSSSSSESESDESSEYSDSESESSSNNNESESEVSKTESEDEGEHIAVSIDIPNTRSSNKRLKK